MPWRTLTVRIVLKLQMDWTPQAWSIGNHLWLAPKYTRNAGATPQFKNARKKEYQLLAALDKAIEKLSGDLKYA